MPACSRLAVGCRVFVNEVDNLNRSWHSVLTLSLLLPLLLAAAAAERVSSADESRRMDGIKSLGLESIPGSMPTFYSPHAEERARYLQALLGGEIAYYAHLFHVSFSPVAMAVLNVQQWPVIAGEEPYGMPSVAGAKPAVFVMPVSWDEVRWMVAPRREQVPPAMLRRALANGRKWAQVKFEGCDGIGTHEIGHSIIRQLGIDPQTKWFNEFLASYVGYAYLKATDPAQALSTEIFWTVGLDHSPHVFTKLADFESKYDELQQKYPGNYGWYQLALDQRVIEIYRQSGTDYLRQVRRDFPAGAPTLDSTQVLNALERINPGWQAWAAQLEAGTVNAVLSPKKGN
jgi:hypothetical protein